MQRQSKIKGIFQINATGTTQRLQLDETTGADGMTRSKLKKALNPIKPGMNKRQIIEKLGSCYVAQDSSQGYIELYYRLQTPNDSKTRILESNNMPIYYASYKLWKDRLKKFEFGFEYP